MQVSGEATGGHLGKGRGKVMKSWTWKCWKYLELRPTERGRRLCIRAFWVWVQLKKLNWPHQKEAHYWGYRPISRLRWKLPWGCLATGSRCPYNCPSPLLALCLTLQDHFLKMSYAHGGDLASHRLQPMSLQAQTTERHYPSSLGKTNLWKNCLIYLRSDEEPGPVSGTREVEASK